MHVSIIIAHYFNTIYGWAMGLANPRPKFNPNINPCSTEEASTPAHERNKCHADPGPALHLP